MLMNIFSSTSYPYCFDLTALDRNSLDSTTLVTAKLMQEHLKDAVTTRSITPPHIPNLVPFRITTTITPAAAQ